MRTIDCVSHNTRLQATASGSHPGSTSTTMQTCGTGRQAGRVWGSRWLQATSSGSHPGSTTTMQTRRKEREGRASEREGEGRASVREGEGSTEGLDGLCVRCRYGYLIGDLTSREGAGLLQTIDADRGR
eukprot:366085-Chlamydomonas_euryale.AAC.4